MKKRLDEYLPASLRKFYLSPAFSKVLTSAGLLILVGCFIYAYLREIHLHPAFGDIIRILVGSVLVGSIFVELQLSFLVVVAVFGHILLALGLMRYYLIASLKGAGPSGELNWYSRMWFCIPLTSFIYLPLGPAFVAFVVALVLVCLDRITHLSIHQERIIQTEELSLSEIALEKLREAPVTLALSESAVVPLSNWREGSHFIGWVIEGANSDQGYSGLYGKGGWKVDYEEHSSPTEALVTAPSDARSGLCRVIVDQLDLPRIPRYIGYFLVGSSVPPT